MGIIASLVSNWRLLAVGALLLVIAGMFAYIEVLKIQKSELTTENKSMKFQLESSQNNVKKLSEDIARQNTAVDTLKKEADERLAKASADLKKAQFQAASFKRMADDYMSRKPPEGLPLCQAADELFNEAIKRNATP